MILCSFVGPDSYLSVVVCLGGFCIIQSWPVKQTSISTNRNMPRLMPSTLKLFKSPLLIKMFIIMLSDYFSWQLLIFALVQVNMMCTRTSTKQQIYSLVCNISMVQIAVNSHWQS
ncbi:hypothetical protein DFH09DRAFT_1194571 [Mycena vulgaris]|nr:hypothetical protein DFH09DRAFT_1194571 [Mycena vulgaris]